MCPQLYYLNYVLGHNGPSGRAATKGTIVHKVLEITALCKKAYQENKETIVDDIVGEIETHNYQSEYLDNIIDQVYDHYTLHAPHIDWKNADRTHCHKWTWKTLAYNDKMFDPRNREVIDVEPHFDFAIEEEWAKYNYNINGKKLKGYLHLKGTIDLITKLDDECYEVVDWKGLPIDTPILTIHGWKTMQDLVVGDILFDKEGDQTKVIGKSQVKYKKCYKIIFDDTSEVICDDEHLWRLINSKIVSIKNLKVGDRIDITKTIDYPTKKLPVDPYVLGIWLGDGRNSNGEISNSKEFIFNEIKIRGYDIGGDINKTGCPSRTVYGLRTSLRKLNLLSNKHIPEIYLRSSMKQRLDLLRGLMDSDGSVNNTRKQAVFTTCNKNLSDHVKELLLSLGQRPLQSFIKHKYCYKNRTTYVNVYPLSFRLININPFLLADKANKVNPDWGPGQSNSRRIKSIVLLEHKQHTQCIKVDSLSNTYLCTKNMIPTHNTGRRLDWATGQEKTYEKLETDSQLRIYHLAATKLYPNVKSFLITIGFMNDGGFFSLCFTDDDIEDTKLIIKNRFERIKATTKPELYKSWRCTRFCWQGMSTFENTDIKPIIEKRDYQRTTKGEVLTKCEQIKYMIEENGIDWVNKNYTKTGFDCSSYRSPGEIDI